MHVGDHIKVKENYIVRNFRGLVGLVTKVHDAGSEDELCEVEFPEGVKFISDEPRKDWSFYAEDLEIYQLLDRETLIDGYEL